MNQKFNSRFGFENWDLGSLDLDWNKNTSFPFVWELRFEVDIIDWTKSMTFDLIWFDLIENWDLIVTFDLGLRIEIWDH